MEAKALAIRVGLIGAGVLAMYRIIAKPVAPGQVTQPGTSASGVPAYDPRVQSYTVATPGRAPSPMFAFPGNNIGGNQYGGFSYVGSKPQYDFSKNYAFAFPPLGGPAAQPKPASGCGCDTGGCKSPCPGCADNSKYPDGNGGCMAASRGDQIASTSGPLFTQQVANLLSALPLNPGDIIQADADYLLGQTRNDGTPAYSIFNGY